MPLVPFSPTLSERALATLSQRQERATCLALGLFGSMELYDTAYSVEQSITRGHTCVASCAPHRTRRMCEYHPDPRPLAAPLEGTHGTKPRPRPLARAAARVAALMNENDITHSSLFGLHSLPV